MQQGLPFAVHHAGLKFQAIAQQNLEDTKALTNWAKSICIRASLKDKPEVGRQAALCWL